MLIGLKYTPQMRWIWAPAGYLQSTPARAFQSHRAYSFKLFLESTLWRYSLANPASKTNILFLSFLWPLRTYTFLRLSFSWACFSMLFNVPVAKSSLLCPAIVKLPFLVWCLYCLWLPFVATRYQPSSSNNLMISRTFIAFQPWFRCRIAGKSAHISNYWFG